MKKRISKMMAMTLVLGSSMTAHATAYGEDGCAYDDGVGYGDRILIESGRLDLLGDNVTYDPSTGMITVTFDPEPSYNSGASYSAPSDGSSAAAPAPKAARSNTGVTGKEQFRALARSGAGTYSVTHKGIKIATFNLIDSEKNARSCDAVALVQRADGKWAINFTVADATGLTVGAPLDRTYMYKTLGVSYVTINDEIVIDMEAESAASAATPATAK
ncbi:MAG: hypothetical protein NC416_03235 [Eubacterium sp.]|nr:hypothetical protein [Eubacterium sp.]